MTPAIPVSTAGGRPVPAQLSPTKTPCAPMAGSAIETHSHVDDRAFARPGDAGDLMTMWSMSGPPDVMLCR